MTHPNQGLSEPGGSEPLESNRVQCAVRQGSPRKGVKLLEDYSFGDFLRLRLGTYADEEGDSGQVRTDSMSVSAESGSVGGAHDSESSSTELTPVPMDLLLAAHRSRPRVGCPESIPDDCLSLKGTTGKHRNIVKCRRKAAMQFLTTHTCRVLQHLVCEGARSSNHVKKSVSKIVPGANSVDIPPQPAPVPIVLLDLEDPEVMEAYFRDEMEKGHLNFDRLDETARAQRDALGRKLMRDLRMKIETEDCKSEPCS